MTYYKAFLQLLGLLGTKTNWSFNPHKTFVHNLAAPIHKEMEKQKYRVHLQASSTAPNEQINLLSAAHNAGLLAETALNETKQLIRDEVGTFHTMTGQVVYNNTTDCTIAHHKSPSSAKYGAKPVSCKPNPCWGCGSTDHVYYDVKIKAVICPHASEPEVADRANKAHEKYVYNCKKHYGHRTYGGNNNYQDKSQLIKAANNEQQDMDQLDQK
eukprot:scaffold223865_cov66-Attheya_sp.AAC.2